MSRLDGKRVAILASHGFEESELLEPLRALREAGAEVEVVSPAGGTIQGMRHFDKGRTVEVDRTLAQADAGDYDALVIPGGLFNPDALRHDDSAIRFSSSSARICSACSSRARMTSSVIGPFSMVARSAFFASISRSTPYSGTRR